jgi:hypothetical protein
MEVWFCNDSNGEQILSESKESEVAIAIWWKERNTIYCNKKCNIHDVENPYRLTLINTVFKNALKFMEENNIDIVYPSLDEF